MKHFFAIFLFIIFPLVAFSQISGNSSNKAEPGIDPNSLTKYYVRNCPTLSTKPGTEPETAYEFAERNFLEIHRNDSSKIQNVFELYTWHPWDTISKTIIVVIEYKDSISLLLYLPTINGYSEFLLDGIKFNQKRLQVDDIFFEDLHDSSDKVIMLTYSYLSDKCNGKDYKTVYYKKPKFLGKYWEFNDPRIFDKYSAVLYDRSDCDVSEKLKKNIDHHSNRVNRYKNVKISGIVNDNDKKPIDGAIVSLLYAKNLNLVKTVFTETDGRYDFSNIPIDSFKILVNQMGFKKFVSDVIKLTGNELIFELPSIDLEVEGQKLNEVVVTSKVVFIEKKIDRTIVNPEALISNSGGNALDVLSKSPGVIIDENGVVKLKGKSGVTIFIDDKPTYLSGAELESYLKSLSSSSIKQIEIMTNPPAHYEAAGNAGIINIKTKKSKLKGINGNMSLNYGQGRYPRSSDNFSLNFTNKRITIFSNLSYGLQNNFHNLTINRRYKNEDLTTKSIFTQNTYIRRSGQSYNAKLGMDYYMTDKTTLGISTNGLFNSSSLTKYNYANFLNSDESLNSIIIADNSEKNIFKNGTINLNFRHQFDSTGKALTADLDYVAYSTNIKQVYKNDVYSPDGINTYNDIQNGSLPSEINIYAFKIDYSQPLKQQAKFDIGLKTSYTKTDNDATYLITQNNITEFNYNLSNHFLYDEMINAAYFSFSKLYRRLEMQAGLRFESTFLEGRQLGNVYKPSSKFNRSYNNFFPTIFLSYKLDSASNNILTFYYGKRINRPFYKDLNPFISPLDKYTFYEGNPYLKPTFVNNVSLAYSFKGLFTSTFTYNNTNSQIQETIEINNGIYYSRPGNIGSTIQYNFSIESSIPVTKWLTTSVYTEVMYSEFKSQLYTEKLNSSGTYWFINGNNSIRFNKSWSAELSGEYITDATDSQFLFGDYGHMTIGVQKKIFKEQGSLRFSLSDVLYTNRIRGRINNLYLTDANWFGYRDTRVASFTFSYRFGKNINSKPKHVGSGSDSEQNRVKG